MQPNRLLTSRSKVAGALIFAGISLALTTTGIVRHSKAGWLFPPGPLFRGWIFVGVNALIYCSICWIAFWCIRNTVEKERLLMVGIFVPILLWPLRMLLPQWASAVRYIGAFWLAVAFVAAFSLLLDVPRADQNRVT